MDDVLDDLPEEAPRGVTEWRDETARTLAAARRAADGEARRERGEHALRATCNATWGMALGLFMALGRD